ncbi:ribosome 60S biogenesis N-terminal-domain-containing protein [Phascolomyces articulosus]|uniref:Ribosome 60S biogenesis N-terminal-domain-containing protein n=1 Tax=Phascolomyces articulosus TaxID=60185 RepID=A0AAD5K4N0_9FUNG|nr:ribosome 60S biogenesis N-terminal-domain-containing protein [Phascolomyces articulosus]
MAQPFYATQNEVSTVLKQRDPNALRRDLTILKNQLVEATKDRVDPMAKRTRPLVEYVQSCSDCSDLTDLWDFQARDNISSLECLVPEVISLFLSLCTTPIIRPFGLQLVQAILGRQLKIINRGVASMRIPHCIATFKVLESMCGIGSAATKEVFHTFNFQTEGFSRASRYRKKTKSKNPNSYLYDLRTAYVRLVLALFKYGDADVKKEALGVRNLVNAIFTGIDEDAYLLAEEILTTTKAHIIEDYSIPRPVKAFFFSSYILEKIGKLYTRTEPELVGAEETKVPADLAHQFLISVCTNPGFGLCYKDDGWYPIQNAEQGKTAEKAQNRAIAKFLTSLKPSDDMRQQELVRKILAACPGMVQGYWQGISFSVEPRLSSKWLANLALLQRIVRLPVPSLYYGDTNLYPASPPATNVILDSILPNVFGRAVSTRGLKNASPLVSYATTLFLSAVFLKYADVLKALEKAISTMNDGESSKKWNDCIVYIREGFTRRLPDLLTIVTVYQPAGSSENDMQEDDSNDNIAIQHQMLHDASLRLLSYYQKYLPETFMESTVDPGKFIPTDILSMRPESLVHLLQLLLSVSDFKWTAKAGKGSFSHITTLLTLYLQTPYKHIRDLTTKLINETLSDSFMFRHDPDEVRPWLEALPRNFVTAGIKGNVPLTDEQNTVLQFVDECVERFSRSQYRYLDQAVDMLNSVNMEYLEREDNSRLLGQLLRSSDSNDFPFSPLLLTVIQHMQSFKGEKRPVVRFVTKLVVLLISKQKVPFYLEHISKSLRDYVMELQKTTSTPGNEEQWSIYDMIQQMQGCLSGLHGNDGDIVLAKASYDKNKKMNDLLSDELDIDINARQQSMIDILCELSVAEMNQYLGPIADLCVNKLEWLSFEPLVEYLSERHPRAGNLFDYNDIRTIKSLDSEGNPAATLLTAIPFATLFHNTWMGCPKNTTAMEAMQYTIERMESQQLVTVQTLVFEKLSVLVSSNNMNTNDQLNLALDLLQHTFTTLSKEDDTEINLVQLKESAIDHPVLIELSIQFVDQVKHLASGTYTDIDAEFIHIAVKNLDLLGQKRISNELMDHLVKMKYDSFSQYCKKNKNPQLQADISRLLIILVEDLSRRQIELPHEAFIQVTKVWEARSFQDKDILSLLDACVSNEPAISTLLTTCSQLVTQHIIAGYQCSIDMALISDACEKSSIDIPKLVSQSLDQNIPMTSRLVDIVEMGCKSNTDEYLKLFLEKILPRLAASANPNKKTVVDISIDFYDRLADFVHTSTFDWTTLDGEVVRDYILNTVLDNITNAPAIRFTSNLIEEAYENYDKKEPIETYIRRVLDHEKYQQLTNPSTNETVDERAAIIKLVNRLNVIQPEILANHHGLLDQLLTSYGATTSEPDRLILEILRSCEARGGSTILPKMLMWGPGSDRNRQAHAQAGTLLHADTISMETLGSIDAVLMQRTYMHFPVDISLNTMETVTDESIYDPSFFLPLFANLISSGAVECRKFIDCNALGLVTVSLSSVDDQVRMLGYQMMDQYYDMIQHVRFHEDREVRLLLNGLKNSIVDRSDLDVPPRIPPTVTVCVAHALTILMQPGHYMYPHISRWILRTPSFDMNFVPMFTFLFTSATTTHKKERLWLLQMLSSSIWTREDYKIFSRNRVWDMITSFYNSALADHASKKAVIEIVSRAMRIPDIAVSLIRNHGLITWIEQILVLSEDMEEVKTWSNLRDNALNITKTHYKDQLPILLQPLIENI